MRLGYLDGWRGLAILSVLFAHFVGDRGLNLGRLGVELFFVLSGRLMAEILFDRRVDLATFYARRISRIYPALLVFATAMLVTARSRAGDPGMAQYLTAITFLANYAQFQLPHSMVLDHMWSLCIEEHMYLVLGGVALIHRRHPLPLVPLFTGLALLSVLVGAVQTAQGADYYHVYWRTDIRGASLLAGVIAWLSTRDGPHDVLRKGWFVPVCAALALVLNLNIVPNPIKYSLGTGLLAACLVALPHAIAHVRAVLEHPLLMRVGIWSYSLYLWQQPFAKAGGSLAERLGSLGGAFVCAIISFALVEQPLRCWLNGQIARFLPALA